MKRYALIVVLLIAVLGMAHAIEVTARPDTGRTGVRVQGETSMGGGAGAPGGGGGHEGHNH